MLLSQDIWDLVENGFQEPANIATYNALSQAERDLLRDNRKKDSKALFYIFQAVHESIFPMVAGATKSKQAWDTLQTAYQGMEKVKIAKLQMLRRDFEKLCMKESENVDSFFTHVIGLVTQIRSHGETLEERRIVEKVLRSLLARFDAIIVAIGDTKDLSQFSADELHASLILHEHRLNRASSSSLEHAFKTQVSFRHGRGGGRSYARGRGRSPHKGGRSNPSSSSARGNKQNPSQGPSQNQAQDDFRLVGYTESDWAGSVDDRKSTSGYAFHLGSGAISWSSKKQPIASLSTAKVEYVAATAAACQAVWMRWMLRDLRHDEEGTTTIFCNNTSAIAFLKNSVFHKRNKHIDAKYNFIRELINHDEIVLQHCRSQEQFSDIFTEPLARESFVYLRDSLAIINGGNCD
eukprot:PITA_26366